MPLAAASADAAEDTDTFLQPYHVVDHFGENTVFPTPVPPDRPALPPRSSGMSTSIVLLPVSNISDLVDRFAKGGGRWTER
ncbi:hypothetical protein [Undibacterium sp. TJN25]|uniref:hypothetical protein n=1 Tax=Undibacterium sp. TJN25 TaxID=3413056 RepID=UPI003BF4CBA6